MADTVPLVRKRRDFSDALDACSDEWGSERNDCLCRHGQDLWCDEDEFHTLSSMTLVFIVLGVVFLVCGCVVCLCCRQRRSRGTVFRTASARTTTSAAQPTNTRNTHAVTFPAQNTTQQGSYPGQQQVWAPPQQAGYPQPQGGHPQQQGGYPQPQASYPQQQAGYPQPQASYPQQQGGYPQPQGGYPQQQGGYPQQQGGYPQQQGGYPQHASGPDDLPPPYEAAAGRQQPYNPHFQHGADSDTKRPL